MQESEFVIRPPDITFQLSAELVAQLKNNVAKNRNSSQGVLLSEQLTDDLDHIIYLKSSEDDDIGVLQECKGSLCIGFTVLKEGGFEGLRKRISAELKRCI